MCKKIWGVRRAARLFRNKSMEKPVTGRLLAKKSEALQEMISEGLRFSFFYE